MAVMTSTFRVWHNLLVAAACLALAGWFITFSAQKRLLFVWSDPEKIKNECVVAAAIATEITASGSFNGGLNTQPQFFSAVLAYAPSPQSLIQKLALWGGGRTLKANVATLNCGAAFGKQGLPVKEIPKDWPVSGGQYISLSRVFLSDENTAYVDVRMTCGGLCGSGWATVWHRSGNRWRLVDKNLIMMA